VLGEVSQPDHFNPATDARRKGALITVTLHHPKRTIRRTRDSHADGRGKREAGKLQIVWLAHAPSKSCDDQRDGNTVSSGGFVAELHVALQEAGWHLPLQGLRRARASDERIATKEKSPSSRRPT